MEVNKFSCAGLEISPLCMVMGNDSPINGFGFKEPENRTSTPSVAPIVTSKLEMGN